MRYANPLCLLVFCSVGLTQGCLVLKTPQIETVSSLIKSMFDESLSERNEQGAKWSARVGDEGRLVEVFEQDGFFVFVSSAGDAIAFDGWIIRSIIGFGAEHTRQIVAEGEQKQFRSGSDTSFKRCEDWKLISKSPQQGSKVWEQQCDDQIRANSIVIDGAGAISEISQVIDADGTRAVVRRL